MLTLAIVQGCGDGGSVQGTYVFPQTERDPANPLRLHFRSDGTFGVIRGTEGTGGQYTVLHDTIRAQYPDGRLILAPINGDTIQWQNTIAYREQTLSGRYSASAPLAYIGFEKDGTVIVAQGSPAEAQVCRGRYVTGGGRFALSCSVRFGALSGGRGRLVRDTLLITVGSGSVVAFRESRRGARLPELQVVEVRDSLVRHPAVDRIVEFDSDESSEESLRGRGLTGQRLVDPTPCRPNAWCLAYGDEYWQKFVTARGAQVGLRLEGNSFRGRLCEQTLDSITSIETEPGAGWAVASFTLRFHRQTQLYSALAAVGGVLPDLCGAASRPQRRWLWIYSDSWKPAGPLKEGFRSRE
jgi:hypothetical protein